MRNDTRKINVKILKDQQTYGISFKGSIFIQVALNRRLQRLYPTENFLWKKSSVEIENHQQTKSNFNLSFRNL